jgi:hypothetical protein
LRPETNLSFLRSIQEKTWHTIKTQKASRNPTITPAATCSDAATKKARACSAKTSKILPSRIEPLTVFWHMDEINQAQFDGCLTARGRSRRRLLRASSFMGALAAIGPWFTKLAHAAEDSTEANASALDGSAATQKKEDEGHVHVVESNDQTVRLGVYDTTPRSLRHYASESTTLRSRQSSRSIPATPSVFLTRGHTF